MPITVERHEGVVQDGCGSHVAGDGACRESDPMAFQLVSKKLNC